MTDAVRHITPQRLSILLKVGLRLTAERDLFKKVNDVHGHQAGDAVLAGVAGVIKNSLRETDIFARYGGEEFALIATATDKAGALVLAERLRALIQQTRFVHFERGLFVTVSIGVCTWEPGMGDDLEGLIQRADAALYRAKGQGRNRVCT